MEKGRIAEGLRDRRQELKLSVKEVAEYLAREGKTVSVKTIYGWEKAYSQPDADTLMLLCRFYGITNVLAAFGYNEPERKSNGMTPIEKKLIVDIPNIREYRIIISNYKIMGISAYGYYESGCRIYHAKPNPYQNNLRSD